MSLPRPDKSALATTVPNEFTVRIRACPDSTFLLFPSIKRGGSTEVETGCVNSLVGGSWPPPFAGLLLALTAIQHNIRRAGFIPAPMVNTN